MTEHRVAFDVPDHDLAAFQRAARLLLSHRLLASRQPGLDELQAVRRWLPQLQRDLEALAGYRLEQPTAEVLRLIGPPDRLDPTQGLESASQRPFDGRRYAYVCLALAVLGRSGLQIVLTELVERAASLAAEIPGLGLHTDDHLHRAAFVDAMAWLERMGALVVADGSTAAWQRDPATGEALFDVDRDVCRQLFLPPRLLQRLSSTRALFAELDPAGRDARRAFVRRRLVRSLLERPVVYYDDLTTAERAYARNESRALAEDVERLTGCRVERRAEGLALIDTTGAFSDRRFPGSGSVMQAALLITERMATAADRREDARRPHTMDDHEERVVRLDRARPPTVGDGTLETNDRGAPDATEPEESDLGDEKRLPFFSDGWIASTVQRIVSEHERAFAASFRADPDLLTREAVDALMSFDLVRPVPGGCVALPALARFRRVRVRVVARPRGGSS
ncbi:MAG: TIGR02678 family protein [Planctomycetes bacterium]|nr:TIGR02678 family protein [Planctomycetota bacterium]